MLLEISRQLRLGLVWSGWRTGWGPWEQSGGSEDEFGALKMHPVVLHLIHDVADVRRQDEINRKVEHERQWETRN